MHLLFLVEVWNTDLSVSSFSGCELHFLKHQNSFTPNVGLRTLSTAWRRKLQLSASPHTSVLLQELCWESHTSGDVSFTENFPSEWHLWFRNQRCCLSNEDGTIWNHLYSWGQNYLLKLLLNVSITDETWYNQRLTACTSWNVKYIFMLGLYQILWKGKGIGPGILPRCLDSSSWWALGPLSRRSPTLKEEDRGLLWWDWTGTVGAWLIGRNPLSVQV